MEFTLIGISSSLRDYSLCHFINKQTGLHFVYGKESPIDHRGNPKNKSKEELDFHIIIESTKERSDVPHHYPMYRDCCEEFDHEYYLINNRSLENSTLIPEVSHFEYFMMIKHYIDEEDLQALLNNLKAINNIMFVKEIDPFTLKSKENLIF